MRRFTAFKDSLACRYGLREAIFLRKLFLWVRRGKVDGSCYERNGILWVRMTLAQMQGEIPYFSRHDTLVVIGTLTSEGLIMTDEERLGPGLRRRKWVGYALTARGEAVLLSQHRQNQRWALCELCQGV